jgi:hypothetical protein
MFECKVYWRDLSGNDHEVGASVQARTAAMTIAKHTLSGQTTAGPNPGKGYKVSLFEDGLESLFAFGASPAEALGVALRMDQKGRRCGGR